mmetsp:Transcript_10113/g.35358  ORF Transcript_10113/g.35358 Transcript_10113/m.35358 type:complete len:209 (-) Transcript_10113:2295-2921(-)
MPPRPIARSRRPARPSEGPLSWRSSSSSSSLSKERSSGLFSKSGASFATNPAFANATFAAALAVGFFHSGDGLRGRPSRNCGRSLKFGPFFAAFSFSDKPTLETVVCKGGSGGILPPSHHRSLAQCNQGNQVLSSRANVNGWQMTTKPRFARVKATFARRQSATKPMPPEGEARTVDMTIASFSLPWKPSTEPTSTPFLSRPVGIPAP